MNQSSRSNPSRVLVIDLSRVFWYDWPASGGTLTQMRTSTADMTGWYLVSRVGPQTFNFPAGYTLAPSATLCIESYTGATNDPPAILFD